MDDGSLIRSFEFAAGSPGPRLDLFVAASLAIARKQAGRLVQAGKVTVNGRRIKKGAELQPGDRVEVDVSPAAPGGPAPGEAAGAEPSLPIRVVHEDADLVVVDKPAGVHSAALAPGDTDTVAGFLVRRYPEMARFGFSPLDAGLVHRLDRDTSGLLLAARSAHAFERLRRQFEERTIGKTYLALVQGHPPRRGLLDRPIQRKGRRGRRVYVVGPGERPDGRDVLAAVTRFRLKEPIGDFALLEVSPETGVMHQIRAHLAAAGYPVVGDALYGVSSDGGAPPATRHLLHAWKLSFAHPGTGGRTHLVSPLPDDFHRVLDRLREG